MNWKAWMLFASQPACTNMLVFATKEEADAYGKDLYFRWMVPTGHESRETDEKVTHTYAKKGYEERGSGSALEVIFK